jgi:hypothetical protein
MNIGSILGAVVGVVLMATGVGVVAGAMLLASSLASGGIIGGSIGKFMNSGLGRGLMAAVSLGSMAYAMYGESALQAGAGAANNASAAADLHATVGNTLASDANAISTDAAITNSSFLQSAQLSQEVQQTAEATNALGEVSQASKIALNAQNAREGGLMGAESSQSSGAATATDAAAVKSGQGLVQPGGSPAGGPGIGGPRAGVESGATPAAPGTPAANTDLNTTGTSDVTPPAPAAPGAANAPPPASGWGGTLSSALNSKAGSAAIQGAGSTLGGIGSGMAQKQATEDALKAAQWGNMQWQNQSQVDAMQAAAAKPITVPQGYLQRANQVKTLMAGNQGVQPLPTAQPGTPLAPSPLPQPGH